MSYTNKKKPKKECNRRSVTDLVQATIKHCPPNNIKDSFESVRCFGMLSLPPSTTTSCHKFGFDVRSNPSHHSFKIGCSHWPLGIFIRFFFLFQKCLSYLPCLSSPLFPPPMTKRGLMTKFKISALGSFKLFRFVLILLFFISLYGHMTRSPETA